MLKVIPLILLVLLLLCPLSYGQNAPQPPPPSDYALYLKSSFANPLWDLLVKEGFESFEKGDTKTSIDFLRKATNRGASSPLIFFKLGQAFEAEGAYYSAVQYYELAGEGFQKAHQDHPYFKAYNENYGRALYLMGQKEKAVPLLEKAVFTTQSPWLFPFLAKHFLSTGDLERAGPYVQKVMGGYDSTLNLESRLDFYQTCGRAYADKDKKEQAYACYQKVLTLNPQDAQAQQWIKKYEQSKSGGGMDEVLDMLKQ